MNQETDPSLIGVTLDGRYRIIEPVGDGSAGAVYRAKQLNVDRDVAVKVLDPRTLPAEGLPDAVTRFEAEARIVSKLRHPHTIKLHDFGKMPDGRLYLVMEFLHGEPLDKLLKQGPLDEQRTLRILRQVAEALTEAHQQGIIHRDLKPGNIFVDRVGEQEEVKVIDFGIAKVTAQPFKTATGMVFGTPAYMSPEQAQGLELDARSDLYSLGVVAYHCLTGRLPFESDTPVGLLVKHVSEPPTPFGNLVPPVKVSPGFERLILRLLAKRPEDRPASAIEVRDAVLALEHPSGSMAVPDSLATRRIEVGRKKRLRLLQWIAAWAVVLVAAVVAIIQLKDRTKESGHQPPTIVVGELASGSKPVTASLRQLTDTPAFEHQATISQDGVFVAYVCDEAGKSDIYLRRVAGERPINLTADSKGDNFYPAFSPDGTQIAFVSTRDGAPGLYLMGVTGESVRRIADHAFNPAWMPDGKALVYATDGVEVAAARGPRSSELFLLVLATGEKRRIFEGDAVQPNVSPHGRRIAYWVNKGGQRDIWTIDLEAKHPIPVTQDAALDSDPVWAPDGKALFFLSNRSGAVNLWRVPIDEESGELRGSFQPVTGGAVGMRGLALSRNGLGVSAVVSTMSFLMKQSFDPDTEALIGSPIELSKSSRGFTGPNLSPDGKLLTFMTDFGTREDLAVISVDGTGRRLLTDDLYRDRFPIFSPDGSQIVFFSDRSGRYQVWTIRPDGSGLHQVTDPKEGGCWTPTWVRDGQAILALCTGGALVSFDLSNELPVREGKTLTVLNLPEGIIKPEALSPDGRQLGSELYPSESTSMDFYLAFIDMEKFTIQETGLKGGGPRWLPDSRRVLFDKGDTIELFDLKTKRTKVIMNLKPSFLIDGLALSGDGKTMYFAQKQTSADIWLLTLKE